jgi:hypothetical protein
VMGSSSAQRPNEVRLPPREPLVELKDLTTIVLVPADPAAVRAFTAAEEQEARQYAADNGGTCVSLPLGVQ